MKNLFLYISFFVATLTFAQADSLKTVNYDTSAIEQRNFNNNNLEDYKADKDFNYQEKKAEPNILQRFWSWLMRMLFLFLSWLFGNEEAKGIFAVIVRILPYFIVGIIVLLLLKFFLKVRTQNMIEPGNKNATVSLTEEEALIKNEDLNTLIGQAVAEQNYRLAIRYYYLLALQKLSKKNLIEWEQQKTNEDYIKEIGNPNIKDRFISNTHLYDFVWYGNFQVDEQAFTKAQSMFNEFNKLIG